MMILKKIAKLLFNRVFYVIFAMAVQLGWLLTIFLRLAGYSRYMSFILDVISILVVLKIVNRKINPSYKLAWTMLILCLPIFGLVLYLVFGRSRIDRVPFLYIDGAAPLNGSSSPVIFYRQILKYMIFWRQKIYLHATSRIIYIIMQVILFTEILPQNISRLEMTCSRFL